VTVVYSPQVKCARCHHLRARVSCEEIGGLLYGGCCATVIRSGPLYWCQLCGCEFPEDMMAELQTCKLCASGL